MIIFGLTSIYMIRVISRNSFCCYVRIHHYFFYIHHLQSKPILLYYFYYISPNNKRFIYFNCIMLISDSFGEVPKKPWPIYIFFFSCLALLFKFVSLIISLLLEVSENS
ncbi:hypothetical protein SLOPH_960 [Spraguea lophii 42_110]|uniref:Uncharacterized protein n=1 Tax=Spraguea lophii (strain 42_110) TaxID=1358809 RepID=S7WAY4_SPRLO|nr:hypothetical protein SLOPH_960 [Spraguea lophii 42_110]